MRQPAICHSSVEFSCRIRTTRNVVDRIIVAMTGVEGGANIVDVVAVGGFDAFGRKRRHHQPRSDIAQIQLGSRHALLNSLHHLRRRVLNCLKFLLSFFQPSSKNVTFLAIYFVLRSELIVSETASTLIFLNRLPAPPLREENSPATG